MSKKKLWVSVASLALVVIVGIASVFSVLAALSAKVNSGFNITYKANHVKAGVLGGYGVELNVNAEVIDPQYEPGDWWYQSNSKINGPYICAIENTCYDPLTFDGTDLLTITGEEEGEFSKNSDAVDLNFDSSLLVDKIKDNLEILGSIDDWYNFSRQSFKSIEWTFQSLNYTFIIFNFNDQPMKVGFDSNILPQSYSLNYNYKLGSQADAVTGKGSFSDVTVPASGCHSFDELKEAINQALIAQDEGNSFETLVLLARAFGGFVSDKTSDDFAAYYTFFSQGGLGLEDFTIDAMVINLEITPSAPISSNDNFDFSGGLVVALGE